MVPAVELILSILLLIVVAAAAQLVGRRVQRGLHSVLLTQLSHRLVHDVGGLNLRLLVLALFQQVVQLERLEDVDIQTVQTFSLRLSLLRRLALPR